MLSRAGLSGFLPHMGGMAFTASLPLKMALSCHVGHVDAGVFCVLVAFWATNASFRFWAPFFVAENRASRVSYRYIGLVVFWLVLMAFGLMVVRCVSCPCHVFWMAVLHVPVCRFFTTRPACELFFTGDLFGYFGYEYDLRWSLVGRIWS